MDRPFSVDIADIIKHEQESPNFNNELLVIKLDGYCKTERKERIHIDAFSLIFVLNGTLDISINDKKYHVTSKSFLDVLDIHSIQNTYQSPDFQGYHVIVSKGLMEEAMQAVRRLPISFFMSRYSNPVMEIDDKQAEVLEHALLNVVKSIDRKDHVFQRDLIKNDLRALIIEVSNIVMQKDKTQDFIKYRSREELVAQFALLMNEHCKEQHSVDFYAKELCVEATYLSRILKTVNGKTTRHWIDQSIMINAKMLLKDPDLTIKQIVDMLYFSDQSAFGKFFKKHSGMSPLTYRME